MQSETKHCQNCKNDFVIDADDFGFYEKINVPAPTFCPTCRMQRRFAYRNERNLHRRKCAMTGKDIVSCFSPDSPFTIVDRDVWWSDDWDPIDSGKEYDFSKPFFVQFRELMENTPLPALFITKCVDTQYANHVGELKNAYLVSASEIGENVMYASRCNNSKDCADMFTVSECTLSYGDTASVKLYQTHFSQSSVACANSAFLFDCRNCTDCFMCSNLRNKQYCILNEQYSREEYIEKMKEYDIGSFTKLENAKEMFKILKNNAIHRFATLVNTTNVTGDNLSNMANCTYCFDSSTEVKDCKYLINAFGKLEESYDGYGVGIGAELIYEAIDSAIGLSRSAFLATVWGSQETYYCYSSYNLKNCFGCVGLRKKQYCILNKQYTKDEYETLLPKVIAHMLEVPFIDKAGRVHGYGEYFPIELSPFAYNETVANDYFKKEKEEIEHNGWLYRAVNQGNYSITKRAEDLVDHITDVPDSITAEVIECKNCKKVFKILPDELTNLRRFKIALPRHCFECRHRERFLNVNFPRLYTRSCMRTLGMHGHDDSCQNTFETSFAPDRPEIVYCEKCYQQEVA